MHIRFLLTLLSFLFFTQTDPPTGDPPEKTDPPKTDPPPKPEFTEEQQKVINDWIAKERKTAEEATAARLRQEQTDAEAKAAADAERARQEAAGEFDKVKDSLTSERDAAVTERDSLKTEVETLRKHVTADIEATLKDERYKPFLRFDPGADAPIADRLKWLEGAKESVAEMPETQSPRGNGPNPPASDGKRDLTKAYAEARANPKYTF